jgi:hypothetical protein
MASDDLRVEGDPRLEDVRLLDERLYEFNAAASGVTTVVRSRCSCGRPTARSRRACTGGPGAVPASFRPSGSAKISACAVSASGYEVIGELPGWPGSNTRIFLRKWLA